MPKSPKEILIKSATHIFATKGYTNAKVADIVKSAKANIAAINYHFGSKENLFIETIRHTFIVAETTHPISGNLPPTATPLEKITAFTRAVLLRSFDDGPAGDFNRIMCQSAHSPGTPIDRIIAEIRQLELDSVENTLKELLPNASQYTINLARMNLVSIATTISKYPFMATELLPEKPTKAQIKEFIDTQTKAALATLKSLQG